MNLLAIDTSTDIASVALAYGDKVYELEQHHLRQHAQQLLPMIQTILDQSGVSLTAIDGIVFGSGPGSFTGLRIACAMAKALAYAHDLPMFGVCSLDNMAHQMRALDQKTFDNEGILALLDARMQELYWAYYAPGSHTPMAAVQVTKLEAVVVPTDQSVRVVGFGLELCRDRWPNVVEMSPRAETAIQLVRLGHIAAMSAAEALPIYVRNQITQGGGVAYG